MNPPAWCQSDLRYSSSCPRSSSLSLAPYSWPVLELPGISLPFSSTPVRVKALGVGLEADLVGVKFTVADTEALGTLGGRLEQVV